MRCFSFIWRHKATREQILKNFSNVPSYQIGVNKNLVISTVVPVLAAVFLWAWVHILSVRPPDQIFQETNPSFVEINSRLQLLSHGIKSTDTKTWKSSQPSLHWRRLIDPLIRNWRFWNLNFKNKLISWRTSWRLRKTQLRSSTATWTL